MILISGSILSFKNVNTETINPIELPKKWPNPIYQFKNNSFTEAGFILGRKLFYETKISRDNTTSCATCHLQFTGFAHVDHSVSHGIEGRKGTRNAPALINLIWNNSFNWDGGVNHLEVQPINPIEHHAEMDNSLQNVLSFLNSSKTYKHLFEAAFGDSTINTSRLLKSMTQFTASLISSNSRYDQYKRKEIQLSPQEKNGMKLFKKNCNSCHTAPLFNTNTFESNGLPIDSIYNDLGRYLVSQKGSDSLKFRVPTLRNIEFTFPYMHDGRFKQLREVLDHYTDGIDYKSNTLSEGLRKRIVLTSNDKKDLIAFLKTLTDKEFLYNKQFSFPR